MFIEAMQSRAKDTVIMHLNDRVSTLQSAIKEQKVKDSFSVVFNFRIDSIRVVQNKMLLDDNAALGRQLRKARTWMDIFKITTAGLVVYSAVKVFFK